MAAKGKGAGKDFKENRKDSFEGSNKNNNKRKKGERDKHKVFEVWYSEKPERTIKVKKRVREVDCFGGSLLKENGEKS